MSETSTPHQIFTVLHQDRGLGVARCGRVFLTQFYSSATVELLDLTLKLHTEHARAKPHVIFSILDPNASREMEKASRDKAGVVAKDMEPHTVASVFVVLGDGFAGAVARSVVAGVQLFTSPKHPWKVFGNIDDGVRWANEQLKSVGDVVDENALKGVSVR